VEFSSVVRSPGHGADTDSLAQTTTFNNPKFNVLSGMPHSQLNQVLTENLPSVSGDEGFQSDLKSGQAHWPSANHGKSPPNETVGGAIPSIHVIHSTAVYP
jgi:hypothetical protein